MLTKTQLKSVAVAVVVAAAAVTGCRKNNTDEKFNGPARAGLPSKPQKHIPVDGNSLITVKFLSKDTVWLIDGVSYVKPGNTLTIEAGTFLTSGTAKTYNDPAYGPQTLKGVLVVPRNARLVANGTAAAPIVFTSPKATGRLAGDFGGVVLLGNAPTNQTNPRVEGIPDPLPASVNVNFGGTNAADSSGSLKYVRIEFPGYLLSPNNEINGLTLAGVGNKTVLSNIQVSWSKDDAYEFFGGTVNADHLVALSTEDDDFDFDFGYQGTIQYGISLKDVKATYSLSGSPATTDANGLESDNDGTGSAATPTTKPVLRNFTFVGLAVKDSAANRLKYGNRWRRRSALDIQNSVIIGYNTGVAFENITTTGSHFSNNVVHGYTTGVVVTPAGATPAGYVGNTFFTGLSNQVQFSGSPFYTGAAYNPSVLKSATGGNIATKGAIPASGAVWTLGWTQFNPQGY
ncbi:hypothetical protein [Niabella beijingensis]|uniref:hypothetical protein n=1 Tax=Niabella beijingensis TaxID=2872700 RepID=UPI001CC0C8AB|nr:hypothetical protein [Niabella beijingensis]MBZ4188006.1 hypothetical protein [Niabella beijingensis]